MVESSVDELQAPATTSCTLKKLPGADGVTKFWYQDSTEEGDEPTNKGCTASAITTKISETLSGAQLASGKLLASDDGESPKTGKITKDTQSEEYKAGSGALKDRKINTKDKKAKYYYLIVKYPNNNSEQDDDQKKNIQVSLTIEGQPASTLYTTPAE